MKQCRTLAAAGHEVSLIVADGKGNESLDGVRIIDVGAPGGRIHRCTVSAHRVVSTAIQIGADVCHLHDPELLIGAIRLRRLGKAVIYDAHEDLPEDILGKTYIHASLRRPLAAVASRMQNRVCSKIEGVVAATLTIEEKFLRAGIKAIAVRNYPILDELNPDVQRRAASNTVCYVGGIASNRGIQEIVAALPLSSTGVRLALAGSINERGLRAELEASPGWSHVDDLGFLSRDGVKDVLERSVAGLVTLHPTTAFVDLLPIKMFEYMSASLPVIASNFPLWRQIIEGNDCGICVDPTDPSSIARAIDRLMSDRDLARRMGENGRKAVIAEFSWEAESNQLIKFYQDISQQRTSSVPH
ncbi:glycosyltransferase family 4 protein [Hyphomicrobium sp. D-2]|uniref:glycosyltransferase family 4 protein n=1 Tax=Hyphomicrobium sp. D-2 TaxID=3041621 RepID=UPI002458C627|nr:glycosyltransferase family 4 protein [Hyphomicrobium sp. D-2]MDH4981762.1 glycosyltransferase family 4 protein [Hyphomicrobium sp. D-2]